MYKKLNNIVLRKCFQNVNVEMVSKMSFAVPSE